MSNRWRASRVVFISVLGVSVIVILSYVAWRALLISPEDIAEGYIVKLSADGKVIAPGWSAEVGDRLGLALSAAGGRPKYGRLTIRDVGGRTRLTTPLVNLSSQKYKGKMPWLNGVGFEITTEIDTSADFDSGLFFVADSPSLFFVLKDNSRERKDQCCKNIAVLLGTNTFNAYSTTLGRSLYTRPVQVPKVTFYRPMNAVRAHIWLPLVKWIAAERPFGEKVNLIYLTDREMDDVNALDDIDVLLVVGHPEYWTRKARETFDNFVVRGGHAAIVGGNAMWWQARYEGADRSVLVSYKKRSPHDSKAGTPFETTNWFRERLHYPVIPSIGSDFQHGGYGLFHKPNKVMGWGGYIITKRNHPLLKGTGLTRHDCLPLYRKTEYDGAPVIGFDASGFPIPDRKKVGADKFEILGFEFGYRGGYTVGTMSVMQRTSTSGYVLHFGSRDIIRTLAVNANDRWRKSGRVIKQVLVNFVSHASHNEPPFSTPITRGEILTPFVTPWRRGFPTELAAKTTLKNRTKCSAAPPKQR